MQTQATDWNTAPLGALVQHIISRHHEYLKLELPRLSKQVEMLAIREPLAAVADLFYPMQQELQLHMHKEEMMLFPAIEQMARPAGVASFPFGSLANPIRLMMAEHDSAFEALSEIQRLTRNHALPEDARASERELFQRFEALERDLREHVRLENDILFPRALLLESRRG